MAAQGTLFVVSAPSGAGKHTILERVLREVPDLEYSVSATSRKPREGEVDGRDYVFLDRKDFEDFIEAGAFVEWAPVHGNLYGTLREDLMERTADGKDVILEVDVQGMRNLKNSGLAPVTIFIVPPSLEELETRLRGRGSERPEDVALRLRNAREEMAQRHSFDYIVVNDTVDRAVADVEAIIRAERCRSHRQP